jgi:hypothetical protein
MIVKIGAAFLVMNELGTDLLLGTDVIDVQDMVIYVRKGFIVVGEAKDTKILVHVKPRECFKYMAILSIEALEVLANLTKMASIQRLIKLKNTFSLQQLLIHNLYAQVQFSELIRIIYLLLIPRIKLLL